MLIGVAALALTACQDEKAETKDVAAKTAQVDIASLSEMKKASYAIGQNMAADIVNNIERSKEMGIDLDIDMVITAFNERAKGREGLTQDEVNASFQALQAKHREAQEQKQNADASVNVEKGNAFLETYKAKEGVKVTESGLAYRVITEGKGAQPAATDKVKVHYKGTLIDGKQFDSSYDRGQPATFGLNQVIKGWTEGLQLMKEGAKFEFAIPPAIGYGSRGTQSIPANSVLIFEVELLEVLSEEK
jgi:FKBP-type peptidyl-prolyl cis-trans isomerase FkpA